MVIGREMLKPFLILLIFCVSNVEARPKTKNPLPTSISSSHNFNAIKDRPSASASSDQMQLQRTNTYENEKNQLVTYSGQDALQSLTDDQEDNAGPLPKRGEGSSQSFCGYSILSSETNKSSVTNSPSREQTVAKSKKESDSYFEIFKKTIMSGTSFLIEHQDMAEKILNFVIGKIIGKNTDSKQALEHSAETSKIQTELLKRALEEHERICDILIAQNKDTKYHEKEALEHYREIWAHFLEEIKMQNTQNINILKTDKKELEEQLEKVRLQLETNQKEKEKLLAHESEYHSLLKEQSNLQQQLEKVRFQSETNQNYKVKYDTSTQQKNDITNLQMQVARYMLLATAIGAFVIGIFLTLFVQLNMVK